MKTVTLIELDDGEVGFEIPQEIIDELSITADTKVFMEVKDDALVMRFEN